jgi:hypothetical protein
MTVNNRTSSRDYAKPNVANLLSEDVVRLSEALDSIDTDVAALQSKAPLASPALTGTPSAPTAAIDTNTTQVATTAFVLGQASAANPVINGTAAVGSSLRFARADHIHPTDTTRAPVASPTFTGAPAAPTAAADTNTTQLATTAFVVGQNYTKQTRTVFAGAGLTGGGDLSANRTISADVATQAEAEAGTSSTKLMTPQRTAQAIVANGPLAGMRNAIINGNFDIWQRGTTTTGTVGVSGSFYVADRWSSGISLPSSNSPSGTFTVSQQNCTSTEFSYFNASFYQRLSTNNINIGTVILNNLVSDASSILAIQGIENAFSVLGKTVTLSFWARASAATKIVSEQQIHSLTAPVWTPTICKTFDLTTTWQKFTHTYTMPTYSQVIAAGYNPSTVDTTLTNPTYTPMGEAATLPLVDWLFQVDIKTAWSLSEWRKHGNAYSGSRPSGFEGTQQTLAEMQSMNNSFIANGYYDIAQIQLEPGPVDTPFELRPRTIERRLCERYYQGVPHHTYVTTANSYSIHTVHYHAVTRITPTVSWVPYHSSGVTSFSVDLISSNGARSVMISGGAHAGHWEGTIYISAEI